MTPLTCALIACVAAQDAPREYAVRPIVLELEGPLSRVSLEGAPLAAADPAPLSRIELQVDLAPGERRRLVAPTLGGMPSIVATEPPGGFARVRILAAPRRQPGFGSSGADGLGLDPGAAFGELSAVERARRLVPPARDVPRRAPWLALGPLAVALPLAFGFTPRPVAGPRRPGVWGALGLFVLGLVIAAVLGVAAVLVAARVGLETSEAALGPRTALRVYEDASGPQVARVDTWTRTARVAMPAVEDALAELAGTAGPEARVVFDASGVQAVGTVQFVVEGGPAPTWQLSASRGAWVMERTFPAGLRLLRAEVNTWGPFERVWVREADGAWSAHGAWALGAPLPRAKVRAAGEGAGAASGAAAGAGVAPPGWLVAGLPQGARVVVARLAQGTWSGPGLWPLAPPAEAWLRALGP